jgi:hypothetical protein
MDNHHHAIQLGAVWEPPIPAADGGSVWTRRFGRPTGLGPDDRTLLVITRSAVAAGVTVNAVPLPPLAAGLDRWSYDVTPRLRDRNELVLVLSAAAGDDVHRAVEGRGPLPLAVGTVALEIVPAAAGTAGSQGSRAGRSA